MDYTLQTERLCKTYRRYHALDGLTMNVPRGSIYGFVGRNGAGKTTLIRLICGLQKPTSGTFVLNGVHSTQKDILKIRRRMGAVVETPSIYLGMSAEDNLKQQYRILGLPSYDGLRELLELVGLSDPGKKKAKDFSLGMRQRLGIAIALAGNPDFLILDEPVNGLDPQGIIEIRELIQKLNRECGITVLISSHILDELHRLATWYLSSLDLSTGTIVDLDISIPFQLDAEAFEDSWMYLEQVGGLAYDVSNKQIYLAVPNALYTANDGQELAPCEIQGEIWESLSGRSGFILENGAYFLNSTLLREP